MKSNATGFWLTVGLIVVLGVVGTIDAIIRRVIRERKPQLH
jgi:hypothetical protein